MAYHSILSQDDTIYGNSPATQETTSYRHTTRNQNIKHTFKLKVTPAKHYKDNGVKFKWSDKMNECWTHVGM